MVGWKPAHTDSPSPRGKTEQPTHQTTNVPGPQILKAVIRSCFDLAEEHVPASTELIAIMGVYNRAKTALLNGYHLMGRMRNRDLIFLGLEFCISLGLLALFSLAYPDRYRSKLWENGGVKGWNSNPNLRVLFYANHKEPPEIPFIWTQR